MNQAAAVKVIGQCRERLHALYGAVVFDEWAIVGLAPGSSALSFYEGPRVDEFRRAFLDDVRPLRAELEGRRLEPGEFVFALEAAGPAFDACVRLGPGAYLLCNHTTLSMAEIRSNPRWLEAQRAFVAMTELFHADPLS